MPNTVPNHGANWTPKSLFEEAKKMSPGEQLILPCASQAQRESLRSSLYRLISQNGIQNLKISRDGPLNVVITCVEISGAFVIRRNGNIDPL